MQKLIWALSALAVSASLGGCATVTRGTTTEFKVASVPPGAAVKTSTGFVCDATPCSLKMPRKDPFDVTLTKPGFKDATVHVRSAVGGGGAAGMAGNLVAGGLLGMAIDGTDGAMDDLTPNPLNVTLEPADGAPAPVAASPAAGPAIATADPAPAAANP